MNGAINKEDRSRPMRTRMAAGSVLLVGAVLTSVAQPAAGQVGCQMRASVERPAGYRLAIERGSASPLGPSWEFGPFDPIRYGFTQARVTLTEAEPFEEGYRGDWYGRHEVWVDLDGRRHRLVTEDPPGDHWSDPLWGNRVVDGATPVRLAGDSSVPVLAITLASADWRHEESRSLVLDLRPHHPPVPAVVGCVDLQNQGPCLTWDNVYGDPSTSLDCAWSGAEGDLVCNHVVTLDTTWGVRRTKFRQRLMQPEPPFQRDLAAVVEALPVLELRDVAPVSGWGDVHVLRRWSETDGERLVLLGAGGVSRDFDAVFLLVRLRGVHPPAVEVVRQTLLRLSANHEALTPGARSAAPVSIVEHVNSVVMPGEPAGLVSFGVTVLDRPGLRLVRVRVSEGVGRAVYWVGVGPSSAEALRLATDTADYMRCGEALTAVNTIGIESAAAPALAILVVEPPREVGLFDGQPVGGDSAVCAARVRVGWNRGFVLEPLSPTECPEPTAPRFPVIGDDGVITAAQALEPFEARER